MTPAQITFLNQFSSFDHTDTLTALNIMQQMALNQPDLLPITKDRAQTELADMLRHIFNCTSLNDLNIIDGLSTNISFEAWANLKDESATDPKQNFYNLSVSNMSECNQLKATINHILSEGRISPTLNRHWISTMPEKAEDSPIKLEAANFEIHYDEQSEKLIIPAIAWTNGQRNPTADQILTLDLSKLATKPAMNLISDQFKQLVLLNKDTSYYVYYPTNKYPQSILAGLIDDHPSICDLMSYFTPKANYNNLVLTYRGCPIYNVPSYLVYGYDFNLDQNHNLEIQKSLIRVFDKFIAPKIFKQGNIDFMYLLKNCSLNSHLAHDILDDFYINFDLNQLNQLLKSDYQFINGVDVDHATINKMLEPSDIRNRIGQQINLIKTVSLMSLSDFSIFTIKDAKLVKQLSAACLYDALSQMQDRKLLPDLTVSLSQLIYQQQSKIFPQINHQIEQQKAQTTDEKLAETIKQLGINQATQEFLSSFDIAGNDTNDLDLSIRNVTIRSMGKYIQDVLASRPVDPKMLYILTSVSNGSFSSKAMHHILNNPYAVSQIKNLGINDVLVPMTDVQKQLLLKQIDPDFIHRITQIYQIEHQASNDVNHQYEHRLLAHGTSNVSVLNILGQGLLDSYSLSKLDVDYHYTGSGLGNGIYFARLDQIQKSYNYTETCVGSHSYIFIADVAYSKMAVRTSYGFDNSDADLVWAKQPDHHDRDEFLAKHAKQVQLKYLLVI